VVEDIKLGELFTKNNLRSIRPADGLHPRHCNEFLGKRTACDIERGTPLAWDLVQR
jgi:pseudaminic acid synthase